MTDRPLTPALLRTIGECLYGRQWRAPLARDLALSQRTVRRYELGQSLMPDDLGDRLRRLLQERQVRIEAALSQL